MKIIKYINKAVEYLCFLLLLIMTMVTFIQAVKRFVFNSAFFWAEECALWSMIWMTMLGSAVAAHHNSHTRIDFLINMLPPRGKKIMEIIDCLVVAGFLSFLGYYSIPIIKKTTGIISSGLHWPRSIVFYAILAGCILMVIDSIAHAIEIALTPIKEEGEK